MILAGFQGDAETPRLAWLEKQSLDSEPPQDAEALGDMLGELVSSAKADKSPATSLIYRPDFNLVQTEAPDGELGGEELRQAMKWRVRDLLDFSPESGVVDVLSVPDLEIPGEGPIVLVAAAPQATVKARVQAGKEAGVDLAYVDIPDMAHRNLARLLPEPAYGTCLLVLDGQSSLLSVTKGGELWFSRHLGMDVNRELERVAEKVGVEADEAQRMRVEYGLHGDSVSAGGELGGPSPEELEELRLEEEDEESDPLKETLEDFADRLALEVQRSLDYYDSRYRQAAVRKIYMAGEGARIEGLEAFLEDALGVEFEFFHPLDYMEASDTLTEGKFDSATPVHEGIYAIGAGLRMMDPEFR